MAFECGFIKLQQLFSRLAVLLAIGEGNGRVVVPSCFPGFSSLDNQHGARRELSDALKDGKRRGRVAEAEKKLERNWINFGRHSV